MNYYEVNKRLNDGYVRALEITEMLGIDPGEHRHIANVQARHNDLIRKNSPFQAAARRFLAWRKREFGL